MKRLATILCGMFLVVGLATQARAQDPQDVTVREINALPQDAINELEAGGASLTADQVATLTTPPLANQKVRFTAVVLSNPRTSGLGNPNAEGFPSRIHVYVRDTSAASLGPEGMGLQLVDGSYQTTGLINAAPGDVITVVGFPATFTGSGGASMQVSPESIELLGPYQDFGLPDSIMDPVLVSGTAAANKSVGDGQVQTNWTNLPSLNGQYVRIEGATILARDISSDRPNWLVTTDGGETVLNFYDMSLRYRNDRDGGYNASEFNVRDDDFVPPPPGARVNIQGYIVFQGDDPFNRGNPLGALLSIAPFEDGDLVVTETPPEASITAGITAVPTSSDAITITADATADPSRSVSSVTLNYYTSADPTVRPVVMANTGGDTYSGTIPAQPDGTFVIYSVTAKDNTNAEFTTGLREYRVLDAGINEISDIQQVSGDAGDASPFAGLTTDMNLTAVVMTDPPGTGLVTLQDDPALGAWSGIHVRSAGRDALVNDLKKGDVITITNAAISEFRGLTQLDNLVYTKGTPGNALDYKEVTTDVLSDLDIAEAHEGMMLRLEDVVIMATNADAPAGPFGEFSVSSDGTTTLRVDDGSRAVSYSGNDPAERFAAGERLDFVQGALSYSFGNYKLLPETFSDIGAVINTASEPVDLPGVFTLGQNYPNPFNPQTTIAYTVPAAAQVKLEVFDMLGRTVGVLVDAERAPGAYEATFDGRALSSGMYLYRLTAGSQVLTRTMLLLK